MEFFILYLAVVNLVAFALMGIDKRKAVRQKWRIPEKTLFLSVIIGGGAGGTLGMHFFHHKTKHWYFKYGFPAITIIEYAIAFYILAKYNILF